MKRPPAASTAAAISASTRDRGGAVHHHRAGPERSSDAALAGQHRLDLGRAGDAKDEHVGRGRHARRGWRRRGLPPRSGRRAAGCRDGREPSGESPLVPGRSGRPVAHQADPNHPTAVVIVSRFSGAGGRVPDLRRAAFQRNASCWPRRRERRRGPDEIASNASEPVHRRSRVLLSLRSSSHLVKRLKPTLLTQLRACGDRECIRRLSSCWASRS